MHPSFLTYLRRARARWLLAVAIAWVLLPISAVAETNAPSPLDALLPMRGLCVGAPSSAQLDPFLRFIREQLAPRKVNTLILRVDYHYQFNRRPEMASSTGLGKADVKRLLEVCRSNQIHLIPHINLLGHQSWQSHNGKLLQVYPEFDETPWVKAPEKYKWPNPDHLYCRSYCPLHPRVHEVVFDLVDEICEAFEADAFHAGMDEVFYIGEAKCPRCGGRDKAELFAGEVQQLYDHLKRKDRQLWIWGDRLLDGVTTGLGEWEASTNGTARAIELIPKDVFICDWHYERADLSPVYFAMKGFPVATCPWNRPKIALQQLQDQIQWRQQSPRVMKERFQGVIQTVWSDADSFLRELSVLRTEDTGSSRKGAAACFDQLFAKVQTLATDSPQTERKP